MQASEQQIESALISQRGIAWDKGMTETEADKARSSMREFLEARPWSSGGPLFWYRPLTDELYEGPLHPEAMHGRILGGANPKDWHPLFAAFDASVAVKDLIWSVGEGVDPVHKADIYAIEGPYTQGFALYIAGIERPTWHASLETAKSAANRDHEFRIRSEIRHDAFRSPTPAHAAAAARTASVKALNWRESESVHVFSEASTSFGVYRVFARKGGTWAWSFSSDIGGDGDLPNYPHGEADSSRAAMGAAQLDFEARTTSCLDAAGSEVPGWTPPQACDGKEQYAFEAWAVSNSYDMNEHPLHYIFLDGKTNAARRGWSAALEYVRNQFAQDHASTTATVEQLRAENDRLRTELAREAALATHMANDCNSAEADAKALRAALKFYADAWRYTTHPTRPGLEWTPKEELLDDCGNAARQALGDEVGAHHAE